MNNEFFQVSEKVASAADKALEKIKPCFAKTDEITEYNQQKVLSAFIKNGVSEAMFAESTGYGYGDRGRDVIDRVAADIFCAEDALVRHNFTCGTHTLAVALFGMLKGDGSLADYGVTYKQVDLKNEKPDYDEIAKRVKEEQPKLVYIQRSRGYSLRPSLSCEEIAKIIEIVKANSSADVMVDNCYGEFTQKIEPTQVGADIIAGSLIKNAGGGIAKTGGYVAGRADLVEKISYRLTTPGLGREVGATLGHSRELFMGLFFAPHTVGEAIKSALFAAALFEEFGFGTTPKSTDDRFDIVQSVLLRNEENLIAFCQGMQKGAPIDSFVTPEPWDMPGYDSKVIMSAGAFTGGASIELSADAPLREPYAVYMQGGLNFHSAKVGIMLAAEEMAKRGLI